MYLETILYSKRHGLLHQKGHQKCFFLVAKLSVFDRFHITFTLYLCNDGSSLYFDLVPHQIGSSKMTENIQG